MTLGEIKNKTLKILDEYSSNGEISVDADIDRRLGALIDMAQKNLAAICPVRKTIAVKEGDFTPDTGIVRVLGAYGGGERIFPEWTGGTLSIPSGGAVLDVLAMPSDITDDTPDDTSLEIKEALQAAIPLWVAANLNLTDLVINVSYLLTAYDRAVQLARQGASPFCGTVGGI